MFIPDSRVTPKSSQNQIVAVKNLEKSLRTSVFGGQAYTLKSKKHTSQNRWDIPYFHSACPRELTEA